MSTNKRRRGHGSSCSAIGCTMRRGTNLLSEVKMFNFPADPIRRAAWSNALKRENWYATNNSLICNSHFVTGKPSTDPQHPDYVPSIFIFSKITAEEEQKKLQRYERSIKRLKRDIIPESSLTVSTENIESTPDVDPTESISERQDASVETDTCLDVIKVMENDMKVMENDMRVMENKIQFLEEQNMSLRKNTIFTRTFDLVVNNPKKFKFYTGLENVGIFNSILTLISSVWQPDNLKVSLQPREQLLLFLMKLRLGLLNEDLASRFQIGTGTVSTVFNSWLSIMFANLKRLIIWPSRKLIKRNMPQCFKDVSLENVRCTIDCTEIFIQKPYNFEARAQTYSNYKHHNTIKCLVGITPSGLISFISKAWGGRVSDKELTSKSGFLDLLEKDDVILADRGFRIDDLLSEKGATLFIPASTKNKSQLSADEVTQSRNMSKVRVHVERAIRKIKTFKILDSNVPISMLNNTHDEEFSTIDKILTVICALYNLGNPIIKD